VTGAHKRRNIISLHWSTFLYSSSSVACSQIMVSKRIGWGIYNGSSELLGKSMHISINRYNAFYVWLMQVLGHLGGMWLGILKIILFFEVSR
jgi:hypothetical protein